MSQEPQPSPYITLLGAKDGTEVFFHYSAVIVCHVDDDYPNEDTVVVLRAGDSTLEVYTKATVAEVRDRVVAASKSEMSWT